MFNVLPLFYSTYSIGRSILTLENPVGVEQFAKIQNGEVSPQPVSIFDICLFNNIKDLFVVENNMSGFAKALRGAQKNNINLYFGLELVLCKDMRDKSEESVGTEHKIILITKNDEGYRRLLKIYSIAATEGFFNRPRIDCMTLEKFYSDTDLFFAYSFYNSFLHKNSLYFSNCNECDFAPKNFLIEKNDLPFNYLIENAIDKYEEIAGQPVNRILCKRIFYNQRKDFTSYITYRALIKRNTLEAPNIDHMSSSDFSFESWKELVLSMKRDI